MWKNAGFLNCYVHDSLSTVKVGRPTANPVGDIVCGPASPRNVLQNMLYAT